jgi:hypothetical protein
VDLNRDIGNYINKYFLSISVLALFTSYASATSFTNTTSFDWNGTVNAVSIRTTVTDTGPNYLWQYAISNNGFSPGINIFDLAIDPANPALNNSFAYGQSNGWATNGVDVGALAEWDLTGGSGITTGSHLTFSFYTAAMGWSPDGVAGLCSTGCSVSNFTTNDMIAFGADGPYIPDPNVPGTLVVSGTPEPNSLLLLLAAVLVVFTLWRRGTA